MDYSVQKSSGRYRVASRKGSNVDETLFGSRNKKGPRSNTVAASNAVVVTSTELNAIRNRSILKTETELAAERKEAERLRDLKMKKAKDRKARMLQMEAEAKSKAKKSEIEIENSAREQAIREMAMEQMDQNSDMVKLLNTLGARAAAFTIRDKQLDDKKRREESESEYDKRMDMLMEVDRLKELQRRENNDRRKQDKKVEDRNILLDQIELRRRRKLLAEEAREQENQQMKSLMQSYQDEDQKTKAVRQVEVSKARKEVMEANRKAIERKALMKQREEEEVEAILMYQAQKDAELRQREVEERSREQAKKERQAKLLEQQERSQNKQAEIDEVRARRAAEERERRERLRDREVAKKKQNDMQDLQNARMRQAEEKRRKEQRELELQQLEYEDAMRHAALMGQREAKERETKEKRAKEHREVLLSQIGEAEDHRKTRMVEAQEEGRKLKLEFTAERSKLEAIRDKMVADMEKQGVNPRYLTEMKAVDIQKLQMR